MKYLYHLTDKEKVASILKNGLEPIIGDNSKLCGNEYGFVYFTDYHSIPYWQILLQKPVILRIADLDIPNLNRCNYGIYTEYSIGRTIPPTQITKSNISFTKAKRLESMRKLCTEFLFSISQMCKTFAMHYEYGEEYELDLQDYIRYLNVQRMVFEHLDFHTLTNQEIKDALIEQTDGEYGFTDTYKDTDLRLWEQLIHYPKDESLEVRTWLYNFVNKTFDKSIKYLNTGGWTE